MLYAEIRRTGKIIGAAKASPRGVYRCPTCKAEVFLRAGKIYIAHFAHVSGRGKPECEDYHPSEDLRRQWETPASQAPAQKIEGLLLGIELEPDHRARDGLRRWGLRLTVPRSYDARGEITMDLGGGDVRRISLAKLLIGVQTYGADPAALEFGAVWVSPEVRPEYRQAVEHRIAGLEPAGATAFASVAQKLKPRCSALRWGESYYFVWRADTAMEFPSSLLRHALADYRSWSCCLLALPDKTDPEIAEWLDKTCNLQIAPARREWALIHPPPYGVDDDGNLLVHSANSLLLAIKPVDEIGEIACVSGQQAGSLSLSGSRRYIVEIGVEQQNPPRPIHLSWDGMPLNSFMAQALHRPSIEPAVVVEFGQGSDKSHLPLHRANCQARLMRVRMADDQVSGMRADFRLRGEVRFRRYGQFEWQREELSFLQAGARASGSQAPLPPAQVALLNALLKDRSLDIAIECGPYGAFFANALVAAEFARPTVRIPRRLRARIEWLCQASFSFADAERGPIHTLDDVALLRHLAALKTPVPLLANRRAVERDLRQLERGLPT